ncbi:hypothetical protein [Cellulomonas sp. JZ18]|uniref:hypothetical protein n=1 Tax=Cellulomonas sp. JZ18 TaxID=2654191 RepID=UPI0012D41C5D|nr:hypothetical protein [Cellulomonas sp. JZ18]
MSQSPGPRPDDESTPHGPEDESAPVATGTGPNEADVNQQGVGTAAEDPDEEGRFDAG